MEEGTFEVEVYYEEVVTETEKAILVDIDGSRKIWFPKEYISFVEDDLMFYIPEWLAIDKGLE